ncbi:MAG: hypothetical protein VKJ06_00345 [Vampirovibrionales bacterium]|nr:hypothetical protein [Vampirovibrionales bacterium]
MTHKRLTSALIASVLATSLSTAVFAYDYNSYGGYNQNYSQSSYTSNYNQAPIQGRVVSAPAGTALSATVAQEINSASARVGDRFMATLANDISSNGSVILPAGSQLEGQVVSVVPAGRAGRNGQLDIRFMSAQLPNGQRVPLMAKIMTDDGTGLIRGGTSGGRIGKAALTTAGGAAAGAILGTALGPLSGGKVGRGAIYGTAVGGGLGAAGSLWNKGEDAVLRGGSPVQVVLEQPLTANPYSGGSGYAAPVNNYNNYNSGGALPPLQNY